MKILIASGIFLPEAGGPASFAARFADELLKQGHEVAVLSYSDKEKYDFDKELSFRVYRIARSNKFLNFWRYYRAVKKLAASFDTVYALDYMSAGFPAAMACQRMQMPFYTRVGGDFLWENDQDKQSVTLQQFYDSNRHQKSKLRFAMAKDVFANSKAVIFTTEWQRKIFEQHYGIDPKITAVVPNALPEISKKHRRQSNEIIFAGRLNKKNNVSTLLAAWKKANLDNFELLIIGDGPAKDQLKKIASDSKTIKFIDNLNRENLQDRLQKCYMVVFPALTDVSPNLMLEAISMKVPFISTREIGFEWVKQHIIMFDPLDSTQIAQCLTRLADQSMYDQYLQKIGEINYQYDYQRSVLDTIKIFSHEGTK